MHNEIFATVSDSEQQELLNRLNAWVRLMSRVYGTSFNSIVKGIVASGKDAVYNWQFARFLFEFRQFDTFENFYNVMTCQ